MNVNDDHFFRQITLRICSTLDIEKAMVSCIRYLNQHMPADSMCLELYEQDLGAMRTIAFATATEGKKLDKLTPLSPEGRKDVEKWNTLEPSKVIIIDDPEEYEVSSRLMQSHGINDITVMFTALNIKDKRLGTLAVNANGKNRFSDEHSRLFSLLREPFSMAMSNTLRHREVVKLKDMLADDNRYLHHELYRIFGDQIIGMKSGLAEVMKQVHQVAVQDSPVLLFGETGVGKDVIGNAIHYSSPRKDGPFIAVNCGAIADNLLDSELFGHEKGAFTGAQLQKRGRFERADRGTIFLDEISELTHEAQVRMLRVLQNREIERVGGTETIPVDIRIIAATNRDLREMIGSKHFREDLFYRLNVFPISIPPLRNRKEDIPELVDYFIRLKSQELKLGMEPKLSPGTIDRLLSYHWPGNVRELENVIERELILNTSGPLVFKHLDQFMKPVLESNADVKKTESLVLDDVISKHIRQVLRLTQGKIHGPEGTAELLGVNPSTLRNRLKKLGIHYGRKSN
jgi:transcriptional regulator with GAF, ATPase, and Fis domain